jgi:hypothetical protein
MPPLRAHPFGHYPSSYLGVVSWCVTGFMAQPTLASLVVHIVNAGFIAGMLWLAHHEGGDIL